MSDVIVPGPILVGGGGGAGGGVFVFRPGGVAADNVYTDWTLLMTDVDALEGLRTIQFDDSLGTITIPAGTWDMTDVRWFGKPSLPQGDQFPVINVSEGATFPNLRWITGVDIANNATATIPVELSVAGEVRLDGGAQIGVGVGQQGSGTVPFFSLTAVPTIVSLHDTSILGSTTNSAASFRAASGSSQFWFHGGSSAFAGSIEIVGGTAGALADNSSTFEEGAFFGAGVAGVSFDTAFYNARLKYDRDNSLDTSTTRNAVLGKLHRQDTTAAGCAITLPATSLLSRGRVLGVINEAGANTVTVAPQAGDTLNNIVDGTQALRPGESVLFVVADDGVWRSFARSWDNGGINIDTAGNLYIRENPSGVGQMEVTASQRIILTAQANKLEVLNNRYIFTGQIRAANVDLGEAYAYALDAVRLKENQTGLVLDADSDSRIYCSSDDVMDFVTNNVTQFSIRAAEVRCIRTLVMQNGQYPETAGQSSGTLVRPWDQVTLAQNGTGLVLDGNGTGNHILRYQTTSGQIELVDSGVIRIIQRGSQTLFNGNASPAASGSQALGTLSLPWAGLYLDENGDGLVLDADGDTVLWALADDSWRLQRGAASAYIAGNGTEDFQVVSANSTILGVNSSRMRVAGSGTQDFAETGRRIRDIYLRGGVVHEARGSAPTPAVGDAYIYALDNAGTLEYRAGFNAADYLLIDEDGESNARKIVFDADGDTFIESQADDQLRIAVGSSYGAAELQIVNTSINARATILCGISGAFNLGSLSNRWGRLFLNEGITALTLDNDGDTYIGCSSDDTIQVHVGASRKLTWNAGSADFENLASGVRPASNGGVQLGGDFRGWARLYLASEGAWTTDINDVAPAQPNSQGAFFVAESPDGVREAWVHHSTGEPRRLDIDDGVLSIEGAVGSAPGGAYGTSGIEYLEFRQGQADTIEFQLIAHGNFTVELAYAMSAANTGDIDLRLDALAVGDGADPDVALTTGTVTTFVPGNDVNRHTAASANFDVAASEGDVVRILMERPNTDTHTGDVRVLDIRIRAR